MEEYVRMKSGNQKNTYRVVDDKIREDGPRLVLLILDGNGAGHYIEVRPEDVEPATLNYQT